MMTLENTTLGDMTLHGHVTKNVSALGIAEVVDGRLKDFTVRSLAEVGGDMLSTALERAQAEDGDTVLVKVTVSCVKRRGNNSEGGAEA